MSSKVSQVKQEAKWQAEEDARTLERAMEVQKDPKRMKQAHSVTMEKLKNIEAAAKMTGAMARAISKRRKK